MCIPTHILNIVLKEKVEPKVPKNNSTHLKVMIFSRWDLFQVAITHLAVWVRFTAGQCPSSYWRDALLLHTGGEHGRSSTAGNKPNMDNSLIRRTSKTQNYPFKVHKNKLLQTWDLCLRQWCRTQKPWAEPNRSRCQFLHNVDLICSWDILTDISSSGDFIVFTSTKL